MTEDEINARHAEKMAKKKAVRDRMIATKTLEKGLLIVHTGKGKGKSTAALGMVMRAIGHGFKVGIVQFVKGKWETGERVVLERFADQVTINTMGEGFTWETQSRERDIAAAHAAWNQAVKLIQDPEIKMVLLDELNIVLRYDYLPLEEVLAVLRDKPEDKHVIVTGRNAKDEMLELADLVTDMTMVKHPFREGVKAQAGVEFRPRRGCPPRQLCSWAPARDVGKSMIVAGLCRAFTNRGFRVRPFKPQNMSNNAAVTADGGEIGRAQALQARACKVAPTIDMNPVLLKPQTDIGAQVVVQGRVVGAMKAREYQTRKGELLPAVLESFHRLGREADLVLVEGAGSASEVNLRGGDIANMGFAEAADLPVVLIGDIERGGVIASIVGTCAVLPTAERARLKAFLINKFRGDTSLFDDGRTDHRGAYGPAVPWSGSVFHRTAGSFRRRMRWR